MNLFFSFTKPFWKGTKKEDRLFLENRSSYISDKRLPYPAGKTGFNVIILLIENTKNMDVCSHFVSFSCANIEQEIGKTIKNLKNILINRFT